MKKELTNKEKREAKNANIKANLNINDYMEQQLANAIIANSITVDNLQETIKNEPLISEINILSKYDWSILERPFSEVGADYVRTLNTEQKNLLQQIVTDELNDISYYCMHCATDVLRLVRKVFAFYKTIS